MEEVIIKENFVSGSQGKYGYPRLFMGSWVVLMPTFSCSLCLTVELLSDRFNFRLFQLPLGFCAPFSFTTIPFKNIEKIEIREKKHFGFEALLALIPNSASDPRAKTFIFVRKLSPWTENFKKLGLKMERLTS